MQTQPQSQAGALTTDEKSIKKIEKDVVARIGFDPMTFGL
jgi:hypothetical protein